MTRIVFCACALGLLLASCSKKNDDAVASTTNGSAGSSAAGSGGSGQGAGASGGVGGYAGDAHAGSGGSVGGTGGLANGGAAPSGGAAGAAGGSTGGAAGDATGSVGGTMSAGAGGMAGAGTSGAAGSQAKCSVHLPDPGAGTPPPCTIGIQPDPASDSFGLGCKGGCSSAKTCCAVQCLPHACDDYNTFQGKCADPQIATVCMQATACIDAALCPAGGEVQPPDGGM